MRTFIEDAALAFAANDEQLINCVRYAVDLARLLCKNIGHTFDHEHKNGKQCARCLQTVES